MLSLSQVGFCLRCPRSVQHRKVGVACSEARRHWEHREPLYRTMCTRVCVCECVTVSVMRVSRGNTTERTKKHTIFDVTNAVTKTQQRNNKTLTLTLSRSLSATVLPALMKESHNLPGEGGCEEGVSVGKTKILSSQILQTKVEHWPGPFCTAITPACLPACYDFAHIRPDRQVMCVKTAH